MEERYKIKDNIVFWNEKNNSWIIIIFPEFIQIDNWHGYPHIHINGERKKISLNDSYKVFMKVMAYIERKSVVNLNELLLELR